jgi:two-component system OmpR family response regulator
MKVEQETRVGERPKKRILVVDDEAAITRMLKLNLENNDYIVRTENAARLAISAAEEFEPDLAILDVMMPELDGGKLASLFRAHPRLSEVPVVFLTAAATKREVAERGGKIGGLPFLAKPISVSEVLACLRQQLGV